LSYNAAFGGVRFGSNQGSKGGIGFAALLFAWTGKLRYNPGMRRAICLALLASLVLAGCSKPDTPPATTSQTSVNAAGGATVVTPDVGPVTPVTNSALDNAAGGGVNSAMMKKAKGIAATGVGSVNSAQKQGIGTDEGN
jgi:hypothetical protein